MIHNSGFDEQVRRKLADYEPEVPSHIWENIAAKKKKRKPVFWFWNLKNGLLLILIAGLIVGGYYISRPSSPNQGKEIAVSHDKNNVYGSMPVQNEGSKQNYRPGDIEGSSNNLNDKVNPGPKPEPVSNTDHKPASGQESVMKHDPDNNKVNGNNMNPGKTRHTAAYMPGLVKKNYSGPGFRKSSGNKNEQIDINDEFAASFQPVLSRKDFILFQRDFLNVPLPGIKALNHPILNIPCPEKDAAGNKKYIEIYAGPDYVIRSFRDTGNSAYREKRKETTSITFAFSAGARFTRVFDNGVSFRSGVNYSQILEKFRLVAGNVIKVIYITSPSGDTIGNYTTVGTNYRTSYNKYHSIDVPLQLGYELGNGKIHANLNAGVIVNVYSWQKGQVIDTADKAVTITTGSAASPYQFKTNIGIGFLGGVSVYYKLNERFHLMAEPYFRYNLSSLNKPDLTLRQKFNNAGLRLGLRYDLK